MGRGHGEGTLAVGEAAFMIPDLQDSGAHIGADPAEPALIVEGRGQGLGLTQGVEYRPQLSQRDEGIADIEPEIDGLLQRLAPLREMR